MDDAIKAKILALLDQHRIMTIATLRPDGWPQATTVSYVNEGLTLYFLCGLDSQTCHRQSSTRCASFRSLMLHLCNIDSRKPLNKT